MITVFLALIVFNLVSCKEDEPDNIETYKATLNGGAETPPNSSTASGNATLTYDNITKVFTVVVTYTGMTVSNAHIHKAEVGVPGNVVFGFTSFPSPINYTSPVLTTEQETDLRAGLYYVNLHSTTYPGGEIRGQLTKQ